MGFSGVWAILILSVRDGHCFASFQQLSMPTKPIMRSLPRDRWSFPVRRATPIFDWEFIFQFAPNRIIFPRNGETPGASGEES
jgi:hypothetical protein